MKRFALATLILIALLAVGLYFFNQYWIHRYDALIARQAAVYRLDPDLVWSVIYEETYFSPWKKGDAGEVGLMQVTPTVARVRFSVFDTSGETDLSSATIGAPVIVAVSLDGTKPFSSAVTRTILRDGKPTPVPRES